ncbi:MAG: hypothetical protein WDZ35_04835 [Crocinitomicaceae bacterium]
MKQFKLIFLFFGSIVLWSCNSQSSSSDEESGSSQTTVQIENDSTNSEEAEVILEDELAPEEQLKDYLVKHEFEKASLFIEEQNINLDELYESNRGRKWLTGSTYLTNLIGNCDLEAIEYLLNKNVNPNIAKITYGYEEWSPNSISDDMTLKSLNKNDFDGYVVEKSPLELSLSCEDSTIFYLLIEAGANSAKDKLKGAIKWGDSGLIKKTLKDSISIDFVPQTDNKEILTLLLDFTNGEQYSALEYGEGGDIFFSDLMNAVEAGNKELVWFMLKTGADPNHCTPTNYVNREFVDPDEDGYYPAITPLSIAKEQYQNNKDISVNREDGSDYHKRTKKFKEIVSLLEEYGAIEIKKCLGP